MTGYLIVISLYEIRLNEILSQKCFFANFRLHIGNRYTYLSPQVKKLTKRALWQRSMLANNEKCSNLHIYALHVFE